MLSAITSALADVLRWIGWIAWDLVYYSPNDGSIPGQDYHPNSIFSNFIVIGLAVSICLFSVKLLRRASFHGR